MFPQLNGRMTRTRSRGGSRVVYGSVEMMKDYLLVSLTLAGPRWYVVYVFVEAYSKLPTPPQPLNYS